MSEYRVRGAVDKAEGAQIKSTLFSSEHVQSFCDAAVDSDATAQEQSASLFPTFHWLATITTTETDHLNFLQIQQKGFFCLLSPLNMYNFKLIKIIMSIITIANKLEEECSASMCVSWQEYQLINQLVNGPWPRCSTK